MPRIPDIDTPTERDILSYNNVPVEVAAKFIGWSSCNVAKALIQARPIRYGRTDRCQREDRAA